MIPTFFCEDGIIMLRATVALSLLLVAMFIFGPYAQVDIKAPNAMPRKLPEAMDQLTRFVAEREALRTQPVPDTEARILWFNPERPAQTEWAVVYLHGFSATRRETAPLAEKVAQDLNANLFETRLSGHGDSGDALASATAEDWMRDTREALLVGKKIGKRILVIGVSTGGTLATLSAVHDTYLDASDALVLLSPNFGPKSDSAQLLLWPWAEHWIPLIIGETRSWTPQNEAHGQFWTNSYPVTALFPMMALVDATQNMLVESLQIPLHVFLSTEDPTVSAEKTQAMYDRMASSPHRQLTKVTGPGDNHVIAGEILSPQRTQSIQTSIVEWAQTL